MRTTRMRERDCQREAMEIEAAEVAGAEKSGEKVAVAPRTKNEVLPDEVPVEAVPETVVKPDARVVRVGHVRAS